MRPQDWQSTFQLWKLLVKQTRASTFDPLHEFMHSELWINFTKDMNMLWHTCTASKCRCHFQHFAFKFLCNLIDDFFQAFIHTTNQYLAAVLRTKDDMTITIIAHMFYYTAMLYLMARLAPCIPIPKARGILYGAVW